MKNKENRLKIGTPLLVLGPHFFEKAEVVSVENGIFTLNNKIKVMIFFIPQNISF